MDFSRIWVEKHAPSMLSELDFNDEVTNTLMSLVSSGNGLPHLVFHGRPGSGKRTRVRCMLRALYGKEVTSPVHELVCKSFSGVQIELFTFNSQYHIEANLSHIGFFDKLFMQSFFKDLVSHSKMKLERKQKPTDTNLSALDNKPAEVDNPFALDEEDVSQVSKEVAEYLRQQRGEVIEKPNFFTIVLHDADCLSSEAQVALQCLMDKYPASFRLMLVCESMARLSPQLLSRLVPIRCKNPTKENTLAIFTKILQKESPDTGTSSHFLEKIIHEAAGNLQKSIEGLQSYYLNLCFRKYVVRVDDWKDEIREMVREIKRSQTPHTLKTMRCHNILTHVSAGLVIKELTQQLLPSITTHKLQACMLEWAARYDVLYKHGRRPVWHIEGFLGSVMMLLAAQSFTNRTTKGNMSNEAMVLATDWAK